MSARDQDVTAIPVVLDDLTEARLLELCKVIKANPAAVIASMIHDIMEDDAIEHGTIPRGVSQNLH